MLGLYIKHCRKRYLMILVEVCWKMPGKDTTVLSLHTDKPAVENPTPWLAMAQTKVKNHPLKN